MICDGRRNAMQNMFDTDRLYRTKCVYKPATSLGQDYKEKHKLDSKQISNSQC